MRLMHGFAIAAAAALLSSTLVAQAGQATQETSVKVAGGGIFAPGWQGKIDANEVKAGMKLEDARFAAEGGGFHVRTGPAVTYWNPANTASGNYTITATFNEPEYMNLNDHPHPYGIVIAGSGMGTADESYLYCSTYGNGTFIVRGFGPAPFQASARRATANDAINKAAGKGQPVTQQIALSVRGDVVECAVNGTVVGSYPKADLVAAGKLKSTDGVYGLRFGHNTEVRVTGFAKK